MTWYCRKTIQLIRSGNCHLWILLLKSIFHLVLHFKIKLNSSLMFGVIFKSYWNAFNKGSAHVHSEAMVVSTVLDSGNTAQSSRPSGSLDHRTDWFWSLALRPLMQFADEVLILLKMGNLRAKNTGSELVRNTQATSPG